MGTSAGYVFEPRSHTPVLSLTKPQVQRPDRQQRPRPSSKLRSTHYNLGQPNRGIHGRRGYHGLLDEPGTPRPGEFWFEGEPPNQAVRLLCAWDDGI